MAVNGSQRSTDAARSAEFLVGRFLARPVIGVFVVVPLLGAVLELGNPSWLLTISGAAALYLAADLLLSWARRPVRPAIGSHINHVAWVAGIGAVSAASWNAAAFRYDGELVVLIGMVAALAVGLGSSRTEAVLWAVAAGAAVALGASVAGQLLVESGMVAAAIAVGTWFGAVVGLIVERMVPGPQARAAARAAALPTAGPTSAPRGAAKPGTADVGRRPAI